MSKNDYREVKVDTCSLMGFCNKSPLVINKNNNGEYKVVLSAYNTYSKDGGFYPFNDDVEKNFFNPNNIFMKRWKQQALYSEYNHPKSPYTEKQKKDLANGIKINTPVHRLAAARNKMTDMDRVTNAITEVSLFKNPKDANAPVLVVGMIVPFGPYKDDLITSLENPGVNTAFSVRAYKDEVYDPETKRTLRYHSDIVTWDFVLHQGIPEADAVHSLDVQNEETSTMTLTNEIDMSSIDYSNYNFDMQHETSKYEYKQHKEFVNNLNKFYID